MGMFLMVRSRTAVLDSGNQRPLLRYYLLEDVMLNHAEWNMPLVRQFQHDNEPKHTSGVD